MKKRKSTAENGKFGKPTFEKEGFKGRRFSYLHHHERQRGSNRYPFVFEPNRATQRVASLTDELPLVCRRQAWKRVAKSVIGVEIVPEAIENAKENAKRNGIENAEFYCFPAEDIVPQLIADNISPDIVILDPPRKGSDEKTLSAIVSAKPKRIVYVSCNPATLARDAQFLAENGYTAKSVTAVDMFPHTVHVESVMSFVKD